MQQAYVDGPLPCLIFMIPIFAVTGRTLTRGRAPSARDGSIVPTDRPQISQICGLRRFHKKNNEARAVQRSAVSAARVPTALLRSLRGAEGVRRAVSGAEGVHGR